MIIQKSFKELALDARGKILCRFKILIDPSSSRTTRTCFGGKPYVHEVGYGCVVGTDMGDGTALVNTN